MERLVGLFFGFLVGIVFMSIDFGVGVMGYVTDFYMPLIYDILALVGFICTVTFGLALVKQAYTNLRQ